MVRIRKNNLVLIDGNNLCWRGFKRASLSYDGRNVELVFMALRMLLGYCGLVGENGRLLVVWDGGRDERRMEIFPEYKKKREYTEQERIEFEEFKRQQGILKKVLLDLCIPQILVSGREADDVIFTICKMKKLYSPILRSNIGESGSAVEEFEEEYLGNIVVVSTDLDYSQLLCDGKVLWHNPSNSKTISGESLITEYGFYPNEYPLYKVLVGKHDGIPGIRGVGVVRALAYLRAYREGTIDSNDASIRRVTEGLYAVCQREFDKWLAVSKFMDVPEDEIRSGMRIRRISWQNLVDYGRVVRLVLEGLGFNSLLENVSDVSLKFYEAVK